MPYKDPEQRRAYGREWMKRNAEKAREGMRRWRRLVACRRNRIGGLTDPVGAAFAAG